MEYLKCSITSNGIIIGCCDDVKTRNLTVFSLSFQELLTPVDDPKKSVPFEPILQLEDEQTPFFVNTDQSLFQIRQEGKIINMVMITR